MPATFKAVGTEFLVLFSVRNLMATGNTQIVPAYKLHDLRFTELLGEQFLKTAFGFCVLFPSWPSTTRETQEMKVTLSGCSLIKLHEIGNL